MYELAKRLDVPVSFLVFPNPGKLADAGKTGVWDVAFLGNEPQRAKEIAFTAPYVEIPVTFLVPEGSPIEDIEAVDREGVRIAVMERAEGSKTTVLGRVNDRASGAAYIAIHGKTAMLHALHIVPDQRRQGSAVKMMRNAAHWAQDQGAQCFSVLVTDANGPAGALYASLGMEIVGHYHYRSK